MPCGGDPGTPLSLPSSAHRCERLVLRACQSCTHFVLCALTRTTWLSSNVSVRCCSFVKAVYVPFLVAFRPSSNTAWQNFEYVIDAIFLADICITFNTSLPLSETPEARRDENSKRVTIACRYLKSWFLVRALSTVRDISNVSCLILSVPFLSVPFLFLHNEQ